MRRFRKNTALADVIKSHPTAGLPLFAEQNSPSPSERGRGTKGLTKREQALLNAPRAIEVATPTRNLAHKQITYDPRVLAGKQRLVFGAFRETAVDGTNEEIARQLGWPINHVVGRTFELRQLVLIVPSCRRKCGVTGNVVQAWRVNPDLRTTHSPLTEGNEKARPNQPDGVRS